MFDEEADKFTEWLGWLGVRIGIGAIVLGLPAYRALTERLIARREPDTESNRAMSPERPVQDRPSALGARNARLLAGAAGSAATKRHTRTAHTTHERDQPTSN